MTAAAASPCSWWVGNCGCCERVIVDLMSLILSGFVGGALRCFVDCSVVVVVSAYLICL